MQSDAKQPLRDVLERYGPNFHQELLQIQQHRDLRKKSFEWAINLPCLSVIDYEEGVLGLASRSTFTRKTNYVGVSYPWEPSVYEDEKSGGYVIQSLFDEVSPF